jgi:sugar phosphate isomerase/epimerase
MPEYSGSLNFAQICRFEVIIKSTIMNRSFTRRNFLKSAAILPLAAGITGLGISLPAAAEEPLQRIGGPKLKVSLNAYSFARMLNDQIKKRGPGVSLFDVLDFCAKNNFDGFDPTGYYFPTYPEIPPDDYVYKLKRRAFELGIGISGTGVRDNLTTSDKTVRAAAVQHIKEWVVVASKLGAPVIRVFADTQMRTMTWQDVAKGYTRDQVKAWIVDALGECAVQGGKYGVIIGVQNHGDFLQTGEQLLDLVGTINSNWCGVIVDTGYFKTPDPYKDMALVAPYAVNWQIKQSPFGEDSSIPTDLLKLVKIIRASNYRGYLPIETLSPKGKVYDPYTVVPAFLTQLRDAIAQTA